MLCGITPERITELKANEIFVFGSNLGGYHGDGAESSEETRFRESATWGFRHTFETE